MPRPRTASEFKAQDRLGVGTRLQHSLIFSFLEVHVPDHAQVVVSTNDRRQDHQNGQRRIAGTYHGADDIQLGEEANKWRYTGHGEHQEHHHQSKTRDCVY